MITNNDIADAVEELVRQAFPGEPVYRSFAPKGFQRPSNLVEISGGTFLPNAGCGAVELRPWVTLTTFVELDSHHQPKDSGELVRRQMRLMALFLPGFLRVKDRAPHVLDEGGMENGLDYAAIAVPLSYVLDRREFMELQRAEDMGVLHIRQEVTTSG